MRRNASRLLSLVLSACLLCGLLPGVTANAAETVTETKEVTLVEVDENGVLRVTGTTTVTDSYTVAEMPEIPVLPDAKQTRTISSEGSHYYFDTFEELKELAAATYDSDVFVNYQGTEPLVISEDLVLPMNFQLYLREGQLTVAEGVTLTINYWYVNAYDWVINGTVNVGPDAGMYIGNSATITGKVNLNGFLPVAYGAQITGMENIVKAGYYAYPYWNCRASDGASLKSFADTAASDTTGWNYNINVNTGVGAIVLDQSMEIPANCDVYVYGANSLTIAAGCELKISGSLSAESAVAVNGTLNNVGYVYVDYDAGGILNFANGGTYTGAGSLMVFDYSGALSEPSAAVPGLDLSNCTVADRSEYSYWEIRSTAGLTKLGTPADLLWGYDVGYVWDYATQTSTVTRVEGRPSDVSWKTTSPSQNSYLIELYRENGDSDEYVGGVWGTSISTDVPEYNADTYFVGTQDLESGTYYFTVTSKGDYTQYCDSDTATSGTWTYVKPSAQVGAASNLSWNWPAISFEYPDDMSNVGGHKVDFYFAATADAEPYGIGGSLHYGTGYFVEIWDELIQQYGNGYYYYQVRLLSEDITVSCNGEWSELSPAYNLTETSDSVESNLDSIINDTSKTTEEKVEAVQALDTTELKSAMLADDAVVDQIETLEAEVGGPAAVEVSDEATDFDASLINIVGANLNTTADDTKGVTLVVDKPEAEHVIPEAYDNSVAVSFSMDLDNVADTENLEVPVQITLPIPSTINPAFLVILHYHANGEIEEIITPYIYNVGNQYYAEFVLTSFSDFIMVQTKCEHEWDEGEVTEKILCDEESIITYTCSKCGETKTEVLEEAAEHELNHVEAVEPTCTENGNIEYWYCSVCGYAWLDADCIRNTNLKSVIRPATDHNWDEGRVTKAATCTAKGEMTYTCTECGETSIEEIAAVAHNYVDGVCSVCGAEEGAVIAGDLNADGVVDDEDVALLLWHTLFPESYEIAGSADFNSDGAVNDGDVARLLWHVLFPEDYPIV